MKQLSGIDNFFLASERGNAYNHVAALSVYDPATAPGGKVRFKEVMKHFERRLHLRPLFRHRLVRVPFGIDRPYLVADPEIDIEFHVRHIALPEPGDWRQLMIQVARLHSRPLDRSRPLWEIYVIEGLGRIPGLPRGAFALFSKFHHAQLDGNAAVQLLLELHALSPAPEADTPRPPAIAERDPLPLELYARTLGNSVDRVRGLARFVAKGARTAGTIAGMLLAHQRGAAADLEALHAAKGYGPAPKTRFNRKVSANRSVEAVGLDLAEIKRIRAAFSGATINDVFLATAGGAVRRYLAAKHELPEESLRALMPISIRVGSAKSGGNEVGGVAVKLFSDLADPVQRLRAVHDEAERAKRGAALIGPDLVKSINNDLPFAAAEFLMRHLVLNQLNCAVSNVRGPDLPVYVAGARAVRFYPISIPTDDVGLNFTGVSYDGVLWVSMVACRNIVPDPAFLAECTRQSFGELLAGADAALSATPAPAKRDAAPRTRAAKPAAPKPQKSAPAGRHAATH